MRSSALIALLPFLATLTAARPHHHEDKHSASRTRKSLSFGPAHSHASFEVLDDAVHVFEPRGLIDEPIDVKRVAQTFLGSQLGAQEGEGFYIREDVSVLLWLSIFDWD